MPEPAAAWHRPTGMGRLLAAVAAVLMLLPSCAADGWRSSVSADGVADVAQPVPAAEVTRYRGTFTVLESVDHPPQLCGGVDESLPPQCGGADVIGWDWDSVEGEESRQGTTWGSFEVTGTWDGESLTLKEPPGPPGPSSHLSSTSGPTSPCPRPPGGWAPLDESTTTHETQDEAAALAQALPTFAGLWVDQSINPALADGSGGLEDELAANDPQLLVLNIAVTGPVADVEAAIREVWGGALCVSKAEHTLARLSTVQDELLHDLGDVHLSSGIDQYRNHVTLSVYVATHELRGEMTERYGGAVEMNGLLQPVTD